MKNLIWLLLLVFCATPVWAQLTYEQNRNDTTASDIAKNQGELKLRVNRARATETVLRPDWYALFLLWAKNNPSSVLAGLRDQNTFDNFAGFIACDWVRDYRRNDVSWPQKQIEIVQKFNERVLAPQNKYRLLTYAKLGAYSSEKQQFVFQPLVGAAFSIRFPGDKLFGIEDDCGRDVKVNPGRPWPAEFVIGFKNPDFIAALPMDKIRAEYFLNDLPQNDKGEQDRRLVVEVEFTVSDFIPERDVTANPVMAPVKTNITATRAIVYADAERKKELARFGF
jgi:hypothetical protein